MQGTKDGYTVKEIANLSADIVTLTTAKKALNFKNVVGNFTATITLEHPTKRNVVFTGAEFEITKGAAERLTFQKVSKAFTSGGKFSTADILGGVRGTKTGYTIKDITTLNPKNIATVSASKELDFSGNLGSFTATIILEHPTKDDATITKAEFEVTKGATERLTFEKVYKPFATNGNFTTAEILAGVQGTKTGYTIKSISTISHSDVASVAGTAPAISINMAKQGNFTATIVLQHPAKQDATIRGAAFQIYSDKIQVSADGKVSLKNKVNRSSITSIVIPAKIGNTNVTGIDDSAFRFCTKLTDITIPDSVTSIGNVAFSGCTSLTSITIPNSVTTIGIDAFLNCNSLSSLTIGDSVTLIGKNAFYHCTSLTSITIPNSVTTIGDFAFYRCTGLTSVTIPDSVTSIGTGAFGRCGNLSINRPSLQITKGGAVYSILDITGNLNIPSTINGITVTSIGEEAFYISKKISSVTIPRSVTSIGRKAFYGCIGLTSVTIPNSVTSIEYNAFYYCSSLTSITIPSSVTFIGDGIFDNCSKLTHIYVATTAIKNAWETKLKFGNSAVVEVKP